MSTANTIESKITEALAPSHLSVVNESHNHNVPENSETHFKVVVVSDQFEGLSLVKRHRTLNQLLSNELETGVHALSLHTMTPAEWQERGATPDSPECLGGDGGAVKKA